MQLRKECCCLAVDGSHLLESTNLFNKQFKGSPFGEVYLMTICGCQKGDKYLADGKTQLPSMQETIQSSVHKWPPLTETQQPSG